jgi:DNA-binding NarL/FixJ family response regulator
MSRSTPTRLAVVSDDRLLCDALVRLLSEQTDFSATTCSTDTRCSLERLGREHDVLLVDARSATVASDGIIPECAVVIFVGAPEDDDWAIDALIRGARGVLTHSASGEDLKKAIRVVHDGCIWARRRWLNACVLRSAGASKVRIVTQDTVETRLSRREREVLQHAATGVGNKELADRLSISEATVKVHLTHIFHKLGVPGRAALAAAYNQVGTVGTMGRTPPPAARGRTTNGVRP